jgi:hypothetical protein
MTLNPKIWYFVIRSGDYRTLYSGTDRNAAVAASDERTFCGEGLTPGHAERAAALGAGRLTQQLGNAKGIGRF